MWSEHAPSIIFEYCNFVVDFGDSQHHTDEGRKRSHSFDLAKNERGRGDDLDNFFG